MAEIFQSLNFLPTQMFLNQLLILYFPGSKNLKSIFSLINIDYAITHICVNLNRLRKRMLGLAYVTNFQICVSYRNIQNKQVRFKEHFNRLIILINYSYVYCLIFINMWYSQLTSNSPFSMALKICYGQIHQYKMSTTHAIWSYQMRTFLHIIFYLCVRLYCRT